MDDSGRVGQGLTAGYHSAAVIADEVRNGRIVKVLSADGCGVLQSHLHRHQCIGGGDGRSIDERPAPGHVDRSRGDEADVAVDAAAGVPTRVGLLCVVASHGDDIVLALGVEVGGDFVRERAVAVGPCPDRVAVHEDRAVHEDAVELNRHDLALGDAFRSLEMLAVPAYAARKGASAGAGRIIRREFAFDGPVVRQVELPPAAVIETGRRPVIHEHILGTGGQGVVAQGKPPVEVEVFDCTRPFSPARAGAGQNQQSSYDDESLHDVRI